MTEVVAEKEKKSSSYKEGKLDSFSEEKAAKIKKFAKEYIVKVLRKLKEKKKRSGHSSAPSTSLIPSGEGGSMDGEDEGEDEEIGAEALENMVADTREVGQRGGCSAPH